MFVNYLLLKVVMLSALDRIKLLLWNTIFM